MAVRHVLLLTNESATTAAVSSALESNGRLQPSDVCRDLTDLTKRLDQESIPAVLVDIDDKPEQTLRNLEQLARRFSDTRFVVLSRTLQSDWLLLAMQAGARHFMIKSTIAADLAGVLKKLCAPSTHSQNGAVVTVLSAGGGCGATTVAVNLANELSVQASEAEPMPSLIVDLDHHYGAAASYLGVDGEYGVLDLLSRSGSIDADLIQSTALPQSDRTHALISTSRAQLGRSVTLDPYRVGEAIEACKSAYGWTVIDAPRVPLDVAAELAARSDATLVLMQLTIKDMGVARQMVTALSPRVPADSLRLLVNRYRKRRQLIGLDEARQALNLASTQVLGCLSNDYAAVSEAVNFGKPLSQVAPRSDFRRELQKLASELVEARRARVGVKSK
jgi:pilus assembly protein CpaE